MPHRLLGNNRDWAAHITARDPGFFTRLARQQNPRYMWIGCADSRVPANEITGLDPGEVFVHRNVANVVVHSDLNALSTIQFAVERLKVEHVFVVGHYGCGGVMAALRRERIGLADNWLRHVQDVHHYHRAWMDTLPDESKQLDALCELNVLEQAASVCKTTVAQDAWARGQSLTVHGWVYGLNNGLLLDLGISIPGADELDRNYASALAALKARYVA